MTINIILDLLRVREAKSLTDRSLTLGCFYYRSLKGVQRCPREQILISLQREQTRCKMVSNSDFLT